jgi:hydroxymethylglutaryl-CoA synthase
MRGIISWGAYLPHRRLDRSEIAPFVGQGGGRGTRTVASFDEDPATMAVEAGRLALAGTAAVPELVLFGSVVPAYADKTNATVVHAALRLPDRTAAFDLGSSTRSAVGGLVLGLGGTSNVLVTAGDIRTGLAGSAEEAAGGDAGAAILVGDDTHDAPVVAEILARAHMTAEFVDRWRTPGETRSKVWDDKFSEVTYGPLGQSAWKQALADAGITAADVDLVAVSAPTARIGSSVAGRLGAARVCDDLAATVGITGAAHPLLLLASALEAATPGQTVALVSLADGADVIILRTTEALAEHRVSRPVAAQVSGGARVAYGRFLSWRQVIAIEPPRRPEPQRVSATAAARSEDWKFGFVGSRDRATGAVHLPPARVSGDGSRTDDMEPAPMADARGTVVTFTIDRVAYSPSPPIVFAVVDFEGGGRLPVELCDLDADEVRIGMQVEMTFRRLGTTDGLPNYFWKARPVRAENEEVS